MTIKCSSKKQTGINLLQCHNRSLVSLQNDIPHMIVDQEKDQQSVWDI